jgi:hypothetical protein
MDPQREPNDVTRRTPHPVSAMDSSRCDEAAQKGIEREIRETDVDLYSYLLQICPLQIGEA